ncbi:MAG TPA: SDR family oxidoreductase [Chitinophagaceae bacterium]|nr:SDR family oxidoreductase [Chitinophagaceae bacterium]
MEWKNKVVVITGATTGIGKAVRLLLASRGCIVYNLDISKPGEGESLFIYCDVRKRQDIRNAIGLVYDKEKRIDMLFANAGIHLFANIEQTSDEQLDTLIATNITGAFCTVQAVIPIMKKQHKGSIVLMGSDQTFVGKAGSSVYGMTKGAIGQLTKSTAIDYASSNIRVNCICPGTIDTPLLDKAVDQYIGLNPGNKEDVYKGLNTIQPLGRIGKAEEIAEVVAFLLSDENSFMTGSLVSADGGYVCQ